MGTTCEIASTGPSARTEAAFSEIERIEQLLSTWKPGTELSGLNASRAPRVLSEELYRVLDEAMSWSRGTSGAFNPLVAPLVRAWDLRGAGSTPSEDERMSALRLAALNSLTLDPATRRAALSQGAGIEEGGFGKGYAIDRAMAILDDADCVECVVDFGGQVSVRAARPMTVFVASPASRDREAIALTVSRASLSTTSGSEKWFDTPGGRLSHVIDPRSGEALPPRGSATVIHESAFVADILSTALYVMGVEEGLRWADENSIAVIFISPCEDGWAVCPSRTATNPGLGLKTVAPDFHLKGQTECFAN